MVALVAFDTLVFSLLARALMSWVSAAAMPPLWHWDILANVLIAAIISGLVMRYFYVQEQLRVKDRAELKSRIQALQSRIRPHFLFNSMNIIATLIRIDPDAAEQAVLPVPRQPQGQWQRGHPGRGTGPVRALYPHRAAAPGRASGCGMAY